MKKTIFYIAFALFQIGFLHAQDSLLYTNISIYDFKFGNKTKALKVYSSNKAVYTEERSYILEEQKSSFSAPEGSLCGWDYINFDASSYFSSRQVIRKVYINDSLETIEWNLEAETKSFNEISLKLATTNYYGRKYKVWYDPKIMNLKGPLFFQGVPGLIYSIESEDDEIKIALRKYDKKVGLVQLPDSSNYNTVTRQKYLELIDSPNGTHLYEVENATEKKRFYILPGSFILFEKTKNIK